MPGDKKDKKDKAEEDGSEESGEDFDGQDSGSEGEEEESGSGSGSESGSESGDSQSGILTSNRLILQNLGMTTMTMMARATARNENGKTVTERRRRKSPNLFNKKQQT
eukprot:TRINITY_DN56483_c0_g1_i3.p1 TRINITY_DN56483_c0_g1~~TRINITY_DN56483_c0_g1_i3.p1  ORF type:complete len:108 (+),score=18.72 TRINITY_DN56483_c0_g1_i3:46-369(+)